MYLICVYPTFHKSLSGGRSLTQYLCWLFGNLGIGIGIDAGISIRIAESLFCLAKFLFLPFEVFYGVKHSC